MFKVRSFLDRRKFLLGGSVGVLGTLGTLVALGKSFPAQAAGDSPTSHRRTFTEHSTLAEVPTCRRGRPHRSMDAMSLMSPDRRLPHGAASNSVGGVNRKKVIFVQRSQFA